MFQTSWNRSSVARHHRAFAPVEAIVQADLGDPNRVVVLEAHVPRPGGSAGDRRGAVEHRLVTLEPGIEHFALDAPVVPDRPFRPDASDPGPLGLVDREGLEAGRPNVGLREGAIEVAPAHAAGDVEHDIVNDDAGPEPHGAEALQTALDAERIERRAEVAISLEHAGIDARPTVIGLHAENGAVVLPVVAALHAA